MATTSTGEEKYNPASQWEEVEEIPGTFQGKDNVYGSREHTSLRACSPSASFLYTETKNNEISLNLSISLAHIHTYTKIQPHMCTYHITGLTLYDIHREPRQRKDVCKTVDIKLTNLNVELTCPICLSILRDTMLVMECAHRFCSECIQKCLRLGKKECPACRMHVPSRRSLRRDENFDAFIAKMYPNLDAYEDHEGKILNETHNVATEFKEKIQLGIKAQNESRKKWRWKLSHKKRYGIIDLEDGDEEKEESSDESTEEEDDLPKNRRGRKKKKVTRARKKKKKESADTAATSSSGSKQKSKSKASKYRKRRVAPESVSWFVLAPHPEEHSLESLSRARLGTSALLTARHLKHYVIKNIGTAVAYSNLQLTLALHDDEGKPEETLLDDSTTIEEIYAINAQSFTPFDPPVVHYSRIPEVVSV